MKNEKGFATAGVLLFLIALGGTGVSSEVLDLSSNGIAVKTENWAKNAKQDWDNLNR